MEHKPYYSGEQTDKQKEDKKLKASNCNDCKQDCNECKNTFKREEIE